MNTITIIGRRWFQRGPGNTYHSARIIIDGAEVEGVGFAYGYGDQYLYSAFEKIAPLLPTPLDTHEAPWRWAERNNVALTYSVSDVARKKDL